MAPFFSVIIPTYKRPFELERAVKSVLAQTFKDFELIIVSNEEGELTLSLNDARIKILYEKRKGANYARNSGIENAEGEFICFLDDDDVYLQDHLLTLHKLILLHNKKVALFRTFTRIEFSKGEFVDQPVVLRKTEQSALDHIYTVLLFMACVCCHKEILKKIKFDPAIPIGQDYNLWSRILLHYPLIEEPIITTVYNRTNDSISSPSLEKYKKYIKIYGDLFEQDDFKKGISKKIRKARLFRYHDLLLSSHFDELNFKQFLKYSWGAFKNNGSYFFQIHYMKLVVKFMLKRSKSAAKNEKK